MTPTDNSVSLCDAVQSMNRSLKKLEEKNTMLINAVKELCDLMKKYYKDSFCIKGTSLEVSDLSSEDLSKETMSCISFRPPSRASWQNYFVYLC